MPFKSKVALPSVCVCLPNGHKHTLTLHFMIQEASKHALLQEETALITCQHISLDSISVDYARKEEKERNSDCLDVILLMITHDCAGGCLPGNDEWK